MTNSPTEFHLEYGLGETGMPDTGNT
jgi:hypothetical protein